MNKQLTKIFGICLGLIVVSGTVACRSGLRASAESVSADFCDVQINAVAPDASGIIFNGARDDFRMYDYYLMRSKSVEDEPVLKKLNLPENCEDISLSRNCDAILYRVDRYLYMVKSDSDTTYQISYKAWKDQATPCFSPDGKMIYFLGNDSHLYCASVDVRNESKVSTLDVSKFFVFGDGSRILLQVDTDKKDELFVINADGSNAEKIATLEYTVYDFTLSPNGNGALLYNLLRGDATYVDLVNKTMTPLPFDYSEFTDVPFQFTPDGDRILVCGAIEDGPTRLYSMKTDGSDRAPLNDDTVYKYVLSQPDNKIVCLGYHDIEQELFTINPDGSYDKRLQDGGGMSTYELIFSADGSRIYFESDRRYITEMRSDGSLKRQVTDYVNYPIDEDNPPPGYTGGTDHCEGFQ